MATSALILLSLLNTNSTMFNMFDLTTQEKNKLKQIKKQHCENERFQMREFRALMYKNTQKTYNSKSKSKSNSNSNSKHYNYLNYNIVKEYKR